MERNLRLILVTDDVFGGSLSTLPGLSAAAVRGGVTAVQIRLKRASARELAGLTRAVRELVPVPVFVNDRLDVALACNADGVHLGADDLAPVHALRIVPADRPFLVGASVGTEQEAREATRGAHYWGVGPLHATETKKDAGPAIGLDGFSRIVALAGGIPCIAIGGVTPEDVPAVFAVGGAGVAVSSGILRAADPERAARAYAERLPPV